MEPEIQKITKKSRVRTYVIYLVVIVAVIVVLGLAYFKYTSNQASQSASDVQNQQFLEERNNVINKIKALTDLPDEEPQMFTVNDANLLNSEAFFKDVANGDILLVFQTSGKVVLYRDSTNQIINSGTINALQPTATSTKK